MQNNMVADLGVFMIIGAISYITSVFFMESLL